MYKKEKGTRQHLQPAKRRINVHSKSIIGEAASADTNVAQGLFANLKAIILQSNCTLTFTVTRLIKTHLHSEITCSYTSLNAGPSGRAV